MTARAENPAIAPTSDVRGVRAHHEPLAADGGDDAVAHRHAAAALQHHCGRGVGRDEAGGDRDVERFARETHWEDLAEARVVAERPDHHPETERIGRDAQGERHDGGEGQRARVADGCPGGCRIGARHERGEDRDGDETPEHRQNRLTAGLCTQHGSMLHGVRDVRVARGEVVGEIVSCPQRERRRLSRCEQLIDGRTGSDGHVGRKARGAAGLSARRRRAGACASRPRGRAPSPRRPPRRATRDPTRGTRDRGASSRDRGRGRP